MITDLLFRWIVGKKVLLLTIWFYSQILSILHRIIGTVANEVT
jgi:hypothetical protein